MRIETGQIIGDRYRIVRLLGAGAMGAVYEGENIRIKRRVAIKVLHVAHAEKSDTVQRFEREAQAAGRIGSQQIVEVLDFGELQDGTRYMVMEHLQGMTLAQRIKSRGRLRAEEASPIVRQLLSGLAAAHGAGIIHRDLKPANVFLLPPKGSREVEFVKILDFGVSKFNVLNDEMSMTRTGTVLGTPYYMSPEQAKGSRQVDARSDLYSVGVILYETITGQVPFSAETFNELIFRIVLESPPPAESFAPDLDGDFAALLRKAMAREPNERFQTAEEFELALADWEASPRSQRAPGLGLAMAHLAPPRGPESQDAPTIQRGRPPAGLQEAATVVRATTPGLQDAATITRQTIPGLQDAATIARQAPDDVDDQAETVVLEDPTLTLNRPSQPAKLPRVTPPPLPVARRAPAGSVVLGEPDPSERLVLSESDLEVLGAGEQREVSPDKAPQEASFRADVEPSPATVPTVPPPRPRGNGVGLGLVIATAAFLAGGAFVALRWVMRSEADLSSNAANPPAASAPATPAPEAPPPPETPPAHEAPPAPSETATPAPSVAVSEPVPAGTTRRPPAGAAPTAKASAPPITETAKPADPAPPPTRKPAGRSVSSEL